MRQVVVTVVTMLEATRICSGNRVTTSKSTDALACRALSKKQTLDSTRLAGSDQCSERLSHQPRNAQLISGGLDFTDDGGDGRQVGGTTPKFAGARARLYREARLLKYFEVIKQTEKLLNEIDFICPP